MTKGTLVCGGEKNGLLDKKYKVICVFIWKKMYLDLYLTLGTKVNSRMILDLNVKGKIINISENKERRKKRKSK